MTLAFVGSNPAIPAKSDPLAQLAEQLPFKQWVRGSNPRRVTRKSTLRRAFSLISEDQRPFEIKGLTVCCAHALAACGLDGDFYAHRERPRNEVFPWCRIDPMVTPAFLWREREQCYASQTTPDCRTRCSGCGANRLLKGGVCHG